MKENDFEIKTMETLAGQPDKSIHRCSAFGFGAVFTAKPN
jgi:hypothetical protein